MRHKPSADHEWVRESESKERNGRGRSGLLDEAIVPGGYIERGVRYTRSSVGRPVRRRSVAGALVARPEPLLLAARVDAHLAPAGVGYPVGGAHGLRLEVARRRTTAARGSQPVFRAVAVPGAVLGLARQVSLMQSSPI